MAQPGTILPSPAPVETSDLHFKLVKRCFASQLKSIPSYASLLAVSNSLGLTFIAQDNGFIIVKTNALVEDEFPRKFQHLRCQSVTHLAVNCDETLLIAGGTVANNGCVAYTYNLQNITENLLIGDRKISMPTTSGLAIVDLAWNPTIPMMIAVCYSDGSMAVLELKENQQNELNSLPAVAAVRCFCWSPKGKQLVVGSEDGTLTQYRPDLKPAKALPAPGLFNGSAAVVNILWISNFQFAAYYRDRSQASSPVLVIVNAPKNEPITFINYNDITYGSAEFRVPQFYFYHLPAWNIILVGSANSMEVAALHLANDGKTWEHWQVGDSSRAEMPLSASRDDTYPLGMVVDMSSQSIELSPQGDTELSPMPRLVLLSNEGHMCIYNVFNLTPGLPNVCVPPSKIVQDTFFDAPVASDLITKSIKEETSLNPSFSTASILAPAASPAPAPPSQAPFVPPIPGGPPAYTVPSTPPAYSVQSSPAQYTVQTTPSPPQPVPSEHVTPVAPPAPSQQSPAPASVQEPEPEPEIDESVYDAAIMDEVDALNDQINAIHVEFGVGKPELKSQEEFKRVVERLDVLTDFRKDVEETTASQAEEVSELKLEVLELTAKAEDARLVKNRQSSRINTELRFSQPLDSVLSRIIREIFALKTFIESQLDQLSGHLSREWERHQSACRKDAKDRMEIPMMEDIFKSLDTMKKCICRLKLQLDQVQKEVEKTALKTAWLSQQRSTTSKQDTNRSVDLGKLADNLLGLSIEPETKTVKGKIGDLVIESKKQNLEVKPLTKDDINYFLDRFEDAKVPKVSQVLSFAEREAHRKQVAAKIKIASQKVKKEREEQENKANVVKLPSMPLAVSQGSFTAAFSKMPQQPSFPSAFVTPTKDSTIISSKAAVDLSKQTPPQLSFGPLSSGSKDDKTPQFGLPQSKQPGQEPLFSGFGVAKPFASVPAVTTSSVFQPSMQAPKFGESTQFPATTKTTSSADITVQPFASTIQEATKVTTTSSAFTAFGSSSFGVKPTFGTSTFGTGQPTFFGVPKTTGNVFGTTTTTSTSVFSGFTPSFGVKPESSKSSSSGSSFNPGLYSSTTPTQEKADLNVSEGKTESTEEKLVSSKPATKPTTATAQAKTASTASVALFPSFTPSSATFSTPVSSGTSRIFPSVTTSATTSTPSLFGTAVSSTSAFSSPNTSAFAALPPETTASVVEKGDVSSSSSTTSTSLLASSTTTATTVKPPETKTTSTFGQASLSPFGTSSTTSSTGIFGGTTTSSSLFTTPMFGSTTGTSAPLFSLPQTTTTAPLFGASATNSSITTTATTSSSIFGTTTTTTASTASSTVLGSATTASTSTNIFGSAAATAPSTNLFGSTVAGSTTNVFGSTTSTATPSTNLFGATTTANTPSANLFGATTSTVTPSTNVFGSTATTVAPSTNIFGSSTPTSSSNLFGSTPQSTTSSSIFDAQATTTSSSLFGTSTFGQPSTTTNAGVFGSVTPTSPSGFGADLNQTTNLFGSMLGGASQPTSTPSNIFAQVTPTKSVFDSGSSIFGGGATPASTTGSVFGQATPNVFGQASSSPSLFGTPAANSANVFGQPAKTTASSFFGQNICSPFGSGSAAPNQSPFGTQVSSPSNVFGSSSFGQTGFGQNSSSIFGGATTATSSGSIFGGSSSGGFQSQGGFSGGPFSGGNSSVAQSGFGAGAAFSKPTAGGFGSAPVFGGAPAAPVFGSTPAFGSAPAFGSPSKVFGSPTSSAAPFGQTSALGFESLATQNTVGFGNIAQMSGGQQTFGSGFSAPQSPGFGNQSPPQQQAPSFGGNAFSSWR